MRQQAGHVDDAAPGAAARHLLADDPAAQHDAAQVGGEQAVDGRLAGAEEEGLLGCAGAVD